MTARTASSTMEVDREHREDREDSEDREQREDREERKQTNIRIKLNRYQDDREDHSVPDEKNKCDPYYQTIIFEIVNGKKCPVVYNDDVMDILSPIVESSIESSVESDLESDHESVVADEEPRVVEKMIREQHDVMPMRKTTIKCPKPDDDIPTSLRPQSLFLWQSSMQTSSRASDISEQRDKVR